MARSGRSTSHGTPPRKPAGGSPREVARPKPTADDLVAARAKGIPDVVAPDLRALFVGINPGLYSAAIGHHFGRPGNRFWPALALAGLTPRLYSPYEDQDLLALGLGITNLVARTTARADELTMEELEEGGRLLERKVRAFAPRVVAVCGVTAYRAAFAEPQASLGWQAQTLGGARLLILPNPSGLNAHHQLPGLARLFRAVLA